MTPDDLNKIRVERLDMTQAELAAALGVKPLAISRWENEHRAIPPYLELALEGLWWRKFGKQIATRAKP